MGLFIYSTMKPSERASIVNVAGFAAWWVCILGLFVLAYFYFDRYRVQIDDHALTIKSIFGRRVFQLASVAQIAVLRGRATDLMLFDRDDRVLVKLGGSLQDFDSFLSTLKLRTRSPRVMLFKWEQLDGWVESENRGAEHGVNSNGPKRFRDINRRAKYILVVGLSLIVVAVVASVWLGKDGFG